MYTLYNTSVELYTRLATAPQPAFHYNILLASVAINSSILLRRIKLQRTNELSRSPFSNTISTFSISPISTQSRSLSDFMALGFIAWGPTP
jgi:hypothetical protein